MQEFTDNREYARNKRRDRIQRKRHTRLMDNGSAKRWHAVDAAIAKRAGKGSRYE